MTDDPHAPERDNDRTNDTRLMTPLILMGLIIVGGLLFHAYRGDNPNAPAQHAAQPAASTPR